MGSIISFHFLSKVKQNIFLEGKYICILDSCGLFFKFEFNILILMILNVKKVGVSSNLLGKESHTTNSTIFWAICKVTEGVEKKTGK